MRQALMKPALNTLFKTTDLTLKTLGLWLADIPLRLWLGWEFFEAGIEFAVLIGLPLWLFIYFGKKLDMRFGTKYFVLIGIVLALFTSSFAIYKRIRSYRN